MSAGRRTFVNRTGGGLYGGGNLMVIIHYSLALIARATLLAPPPGQCRMWGNLALKFGIGLENLPIFVLSCAAAPGVRGRFFLLLLLIEFWKLLARGSLNGTDPLWLQLLNRAKRGVGIYQTGIDVFFIARYQPRLDACIGRM